MKYYILIFFLMSLVQVYAQEAYYVSKSGNDLNSGTVDTPWQTIQHGLDQLMPGDSLLIFEGEYKGNFEVLRSGSKIAAITIMSVPGEEVILSSNGEQLKPTLLIYNQENIVIEGLILRENAGSAAIDIDLSSNIVIKRNSIYHNKTGVHIKNTNLASSQSGIMLKNNLIFQNLENGLVVGPEDPDSGSGLLEQIVVRNNTFFENDAKQADLGEIQLTNCQNCLFTNNILSMNEQSLAGEVHEFFFNLEFDYNIYNSVSGTESLLMYWNGIAVNGFENFQNTSGKEQNGQYLNPLFLDVSSSIPDLHLTPNSPAINLGNPNAFFELGETDIDGEPRINNQPDVGADEYHLKLIICALGVFDAIQVESGILMSWSGTCFSENGGLYEVQRSRDKSNWESIGEVNSDSEKFGREVFYHFLDEQPWEGWSFYRVRFIDENGSFLDSNIDEVVFSDRDVLVYPNPVLGELNIILANDQQIEQVLFYNANGMLVKKEIYTEKFFINELASGQYFIQFIDELGINKNCILFIKL